MLLLHTGYNGAGTTPSGPDRCARQRVTLKAVQMLVSVKTRRLLTQTKFIFFVTEFIYTSISTTARLLRSWVRVPPGAWMFVVVFVMCCRVEVSETSWSLVQRSPIDCGASLRVIKKPRGRGGHSPRWAAVPEKKNPCALILFTTCVLWVCRKPLDVQISAGRLNCFNVWFLRLIVSAMCWMHSVILTVLI
jgi:hypothetical protein